MATSMICSSLLGEEPFFSKRQLVLPVICRRDEAMIAFQTAWGLPVVVYLVCGGLSGGVFTAAAFLRFRLPRRAGRTVCACSWCAVGLLAVGLFALLLELGQPLRVLFPWESFGNAMSWMAIGAWVAFFSLLVFFCVAFLSTRKAIAFGALRLPGFRDHYRKIRTALLFAGCALSVGLVGYTGILLQQARGIPFWDTVFLPCLFVVSAYGTGLNAMMLVSVCTGEVRVLFGKRSFPVVQAFVVLTLLETALLILFLANGSGFFPVFNAGFGDYPAAYAAACSTQCLLSGHLAVQFWVFVVGFGILIPLVTCVFAIFLQRASVAFYMCAALCSLVGEWFLRSLILSAGAYADYVAAALSSLS